jgi:hypothetical protein
MVCLEQRDLRRLKKLKYLTIQSSVQFWRGFDYPNWCLVFFFSLRNGGCVVLHVSGRQLRTHTSWPCPCGHGPGTTTEVVEAIGTGTWASPEVVPVPVPVPVLRNALHCLLVPWAESSTPNPVAPLYREWKQDSSLQAILWSSVQLWL